MASSTGTSDWGPKISSAGMKSDINVTPLVDVCLVLLIIFMVVTPMLQSGVDVNLPETNRPEKVQEGKNQLTVAIKADEQIFLGDKWVPKDQFADKMKQMFVDHPEKDIRIKADKNLKYGLVKDIMRMVNDAGYTKAGLITMKKTTKG